MPRTAFEFQREIDKFLDLFVRLISLFHLGHGLKRLRNAHITASDRRRDHLRHFFDRAEFHT